MIVVMLIWERDYIDRTRTEFRLRIGLCLRFKHALPISRHRTMRVTPQDRHSRKQMRLLISTLTE
jgi:hypothetical protein